MTHLYEVGTGAESVFTALLLYPFGNIIGATYTQLLVCTYTSSPMTRWIIKMKTCTFDVHEDKILLVRARYKQIQPMSCHFLLPVLQ